MDSTAVQALHDAIQNTATMQERQDRLADLVDAVDDEVRKNAAAIAGKADDSALEAVAKSGSYNDLSNKPDIPARTLDNTITDFNTLTNANKYYVSSQQLSHISNAPTVSTSNICFRLDIKYLDYVYLVQILYVIHSNSFTIYTRGRLDPDVWTAWKQVSLI